jgi:serine/threonine-protein kinase
MLKPGDLLGERYEILEAIGGGGMSTLWRARHVELEVDVALKVISGANAGERALERFKREARWIAKLNSPNIVRIIDFGDFKGQPYLAMELLRGEDLAARLAREGPLSFATCRRIVAGIASAVHVAHEAGIVHRDLKPANVFLERVADEEGVKILDFGVAKDINAPAAPGATTAGELVGTPAYMSPEQVWSQEVSPRSDVWAMGVIALEMLTGSNPFLDETLAKIFERIIREPLPVPSVLSPGLSAEIDAFFSRALARASKDRLGSAREFSQGFAAALDGREPPATAPHPLPRRSEQEQASRAAVTARSRRNQGDRGFQPLVVVLVLVVASGALFALSRRTRQEPTAKRVVSMAPRAPEVSASPEADTAATPTTPPGTAPSAKDVPSSPTNRASPSATVPALPRGAISRKAGPPSPAPAPSATARDPRFGIPLGR